jgi:ribosomal protein S18 acetylase RimI-like enzyme
MDLHLAAQAVLADEPTALAAVSLMETVLAGEEGPLAEPSRLLLARAAANPSLHVRRRAFRVLVHSEKESRFPATLASFLAFPGVVLDDETRSVLCERDLPEATLGAFIRAAETAIAVPEWDHDAEQLAESLLGFLADYGAAHPTQYRRLRAFLFRILVATDRESARAAAARAADHLLEGFRRWLGPAQRIAVDPETGHEYRWQDVVAFDKGVSDEDRGRVLSAMRDASMLREAVFLFSKGAIVRLNDIPPGGVWIRHLGTSHGKSVHRVTVQTRHQESYEVAVNINHDLSERDVREEIQWLILCGAAAGRDPLVEDFGGYWEEQDLWTEEFVPGHTLDVALKRMSRREDEAERVRQIWPFYAWSAMSAYVDFWNRTGRRLEISDPSTASVIVPAHDYLTGARIVSLSARRPFAALIPMILALRSRLVQPVEEEYAPLKGVVGWDVIFSSVLEIVGEDEGTRMLLAAMEETGEDADDDLRFALDRFLSQVEARGFVPMRLYFASQRYLRWSRLSGQPTTQARARTLQELWDTYGLQRLVQAYPEARVRFFRETVFHDAPQPLVEGLEEIISAMRRGEVVGDALVDAVADLRARLSLGADDDSFLARLPFPHLRPEDAAGYVQADLGGRHQSEMVVSLHDQEGSPFLVRHALNPKEVARLHRLFLESNLDIRFRPEHQYLVALNERGQIIGGIYYDVEPESGSAHLEKIVVAERHRRIGVANGLMNELFNRLRAAGTKTVTTGFYRPEYFYSFGFTIEKRYAGLVKNLEHDS